MVYHSNEIPLDICFQFNWSAAYALCVLKHRYNQNCPFLVQSHISQFRILVLRHVNVRGGNAIKPFA